MISIRNITALAVALAFACTVSLAQAKFTGVKMCGACHKQEKTGATYTKWEKSAHAGAYKTLLTEKANAIAKEKGLKKPAAESVECLECHVTGGGAATNVEKTFLKEEGVTCEACHGAASGYKTIHSKPENKEKSVAAGLGKGNKEDAAACKKCHNEKSPTFKGFTMAESWAKIAHNLPAKSTK
jgi:hypothetical protein